MPTLPRPWASSFSKPRKAGLKPSGKLGRKGFSPEKAAKKAARYLENFGGDDLREEITRHGCCRCGNRRRKIEAAHIQTRGACYHLEKLAFPDREDAVTGNVVPLCSRCHRSQNKWLAEEIGNLQAVADALFGGLYDEQFLPLRTCSACKAVVFARRFRPFEGEPGGICDSCDEELGRRAVAARKEAA